MKPQFIEKKQLGKYSVAPYNFVNFPKKAAIKYSSPEELPAHNDFRGRDKSKLLSGYIEYTLEAKTPIIVSKGTEDKHANFFVNTSGKYAIPGNTIRGMVRTNSQILSFSSPIGNKDSDGKYSNSEIANSRFLYRDIAGNGSLARKYKDVLDIDINRRISRNLKAGYIFYKNGELVIQPAKELKKDIPYFRVDEIFLRKKVGNSIVGINYLYKPEILQKEEELKRLNELIGKKINIKENGRKVNRILRGVENQRNYKPYQTEISFEFDNKTGKITNIGKKGKYSNLGYILSGGFILGKRSHYIVPEMDMESGSIEISQEDKETYIDDLILTKKADIGKGGAVKVNKEFEFFALPEYNEKKPVFYINTETNGLHFGFTPYLRMFYSKSILDGIPEGYKNIEGISYTDGIFGFTNKPYKKNGEIKDYSYKSRVSFEDAEVIGEAKVDSESTMEILLAEPKPTSYNLYLEQDGNSNKKTLNIYEGDFTIRGFKQYWLKDYVEDLGVEGSKAKNMKFIIHPLKEGTQFKAKIYFENLDEEELGLLIWSLKLDENCYQNIGLAKPHGFGRVKVKDIILNMEDLDKKYNSFSFDYYEEADLDKYIDIYKDNFSRKNLNGRSIDEQKPVKELMLIKSKVVKIEDANYYRYMEIERQEMIKGRNKKINEFKDMNVLPEILEYEKLVKSPQKKNLYGQTRNNNKSRKNNRQNNRKNEQTNNAFAMAFKKAEKEKQKKK